MTCAQVPATPCGLAAPASGCCPTTTTTAPPSTCAQLSIPSPITATVTVVGTDTQVVQDIRTAIGSTSCCLTMDVTLEVTRPTGSNTQNTVAKVFVVDGVGNVFSGGTSYGVCGGGDCFNLTAGFDGSPASTSCKLTISRGSALTYMTFSGTIKVTIPAGGASGVRVLVTSNSNQAPTGAFVVATVTSLSIS
jgi:hypothetical protein